MKKSTVKSIAFAAALFAALPLSATTIKALSFAISEGHGSGEGVPMKAYMATNDVDFGAFDYTKGTTTAYFIGSNFSQNGKNYNVTNLNYSIPGYVVFVWNSDRYELVDDPALNKADNCMAAAFRTELGDVYVLISMRGRTSVSSVKDYLDQLASKYPGAKFVVTYNARLSTATADTLNTSLTDSTSGPGMTCLGRTEVDGTAVGGVYMYPADVPKSYSVSLVPKLLKANGTDTIKYNGTLLTFEVPTKWKVVFNDWDGTGLQTNIVFAGESVTPPTVPGRDGYTFTGWDHPASDFASVSESFTATAQYASNAAWLHVSGDPEDLGTAVPVYGAITEIAASETFTATISNPAVEEGATERWVCTGYTHYEITDLATGAKTVAQEGNTASFAYTHVMHDELVWHFTNEWLVAVSASQGGSVSISESWVRNGETFQLVATPEEGYALWRWEGDTDGIADVTSASISVAVTSARSLRAVFAPQGADASVQYVATTGNDANNGYSSESPKLTIQAAVNTLAEAAGYGTVHVAEGTYQITSGIVITNAITVIGETGDPENVIVRNTKMGNQDQVIVFSLNHPDAFVANLTAADSHRYAPTSPYGGNVSIQEEGGTVSNCILRGAVSGGNYTRGAGAWLNSDNALLTHCVITNNSASGSGYQSTAAGGVPIYGGIFVHVERGTVANCLIANNHDSGGTGAASQEKQAWSCGVTLRTSGRLVNCTVVTNEARYTAGVYLYPTSYATNVVVAGCVNCCTWYNGGETPIFTEIGFKGALDNASHCASDGGEALNDTCVAGTAAEFFRSMEARDYRPALTSPLINKGVIYEGIASFDLLGKKRVQGSKPDIGCFESAPSGLSVVIR